MPTMELGFLARELERSVGPTLMAPTQARELRRVDPTFLDGWLRLGKGHARTKIQPTSAAITFAMIVERRDGRRMVLTGDTAGTLRLTVPTGAPGCASSLVESDDPTEFSTVPFCENFNEECPDVPDPYPYF